MVKEKEIEFMVRLKGKQAKYLSDFVDKGYYATKSEVVRAGILELVQKHKVAEEELEKELLGKAIERDMKEIKQGKSKLRSEKEFQKKFSRGKPSKKEVVLVNKATAKEMDKIKKGKIKTHTLEEVLKKYPKMKN